MDVFCYGLWRARMTCAYGLKVPSVSKDMSYKTDMTGWVLSDGLVWMAPSVARGFPVCQVFRMRKNEGPTYWSSESGEKLMIACCDVVCVLVGACVSDSQSVPRLHAARHNIYMRKVDSV